MNNSAVSAGAKQSFDTNEGVLVFRGGWGRLNTLTPPPPQNSEEMRDSETTKNHLALVERSENDVLFLLQGHTGYSSHPTGEYGHRRQHHPPDQDHSNGRGQHQEVLREW